MWWIFRVPQDNNTPYKCCKTPPGYYIDYISCYYVPTHDEYFEFYDSINQFIVYCAQGYVMTGISKKINPYTREWHMDWIQCCRVGYGPPAAHPPPVSYTAGGVPSYHAVSGGLTKTGPAYQAQYRTNNEVESDVENVSGKFTNSSLRKSGNEISPGTEIEKLLLLSRGIRPKSEEGVSVSDRTFEM